MISKYDAPATMFPEYVPKLMDELVAERGGTWRAAGDHMQFDIVHFVWVRGDRADSWAMQFNEPDFTINSAKYRIQQMLMESAAA